MADLREFERGGVEPPQPHYTVDTLPAAEAQTLLRREAETWAAAALAGPKGGARTVIGIRGAAGLGKSTTLLEAVLPLLRAGLRVTFFVPRLNLGDELAGKAIANLEAVAEAERGDSDPLEIWEPPPPLPPVGVLRGREAVDVAGAAVCGRAALVNALQRKGLSAYRNLCERFAVQDGSPVALLCPMAHRCAHYQQSNDARPGLFFAPHAYLTTPAPSGQRKPDAVIIDESWWQVAIKERSINLEDWLADRVWLGDAPVDEDDFTLGLARAWLVRRAGLVHQLMLAGTAPADWPAHGLTADDCRRAARLEGESAAPAIDPAMADTAIGAVLEAHTPTPASRLAGLWRALAVEIETARSALHSVTLGKAGPTDARRTVIAWFKRSDLRGVPAEAPVLLLDASMDPEIVRLWFPTIRIVRLDVERKALVVGLTDRALGQSSLVELADKNGGSNAGRTFARNNRLALANLFEVVSATAGPTLLATYKAILPTLRDHPDTTATVARAISKNPAIAKISPLGHLGGLRGSDDYRDYAAVIVAGRLQPTVLAVENLARALFFDAVMPLAFLGANRLPKVERRRRMRDGSESVALVEAHPAPRIQAVLEQCRERELEQVVDRLRLIHRIRPALVIVASSVVLDITYDAVLPWSDLVPSRAVSALVRGGVLPANAGLRAAAFPDLWTSADAAKKDGQRAGQLGDNPLWKLIQRALSPNCGTAKPLAMDATYRRDGVRGLPSAAKVLADLTDDDIKAALEGLHGGAIKDLRVVRPVAAEAVPEGVSDATAPGHGTGLLAVGGVVVPFPNAIPGTANTDTRCNCGARPQSRIAAA
ncbi:hypothetical protein ABMY26_23985 [Azospirillum sp. HJ39]|uniref:hypothetical protein n=1 Tax=Azospirillum sp. HJ39 TaxID=3159496 RepID=UPI0035560863